MIPVYEPFLDRDSLKHTLSNTINTGWIGPGVATEQLEEIITQLTSKKYAIAVNSGTTALFIACKFLVYSNCTISKPIILIPSYGYVAAANAVSISGAEPMAVDVDLNTLCISPDKLIEFLHTNESIRNRIIGCIFINHNGYVGPQYIECNNILNNNNITMISDSAVAIGIDNAGSLGLCGLFSFSVPKLITTGQGGCLFTDSKQFYHYAKQMRDQGDNWRHDRIHKNIGLNFRMPDLLASIGITQLNDIDKLLLRRCNLWNQYRELLKPGLLVETGNISNWCVIIKSNNVDTLITKLKENNISASRFYMSIYNNDAYKHLKKQNCDVRNGDYLEKILLYLPSSLNLTSQNIIHICNIVNKYA